MATSTRDALIAAATDLLDVGGVDGVTLREVGNRAGVSHNAPYKHFADKEMLLAAVAARELDHLREVMVTAQAEGVAAEEVLRRALREYVAWALERPARFALVFGRWSHHSETLGSSAAAAWDVLVAATAAAQRAGGLPGDDPERMAALLRAAAHGAVELALTGHLAADGKGKVAPDELVEDLFGYLRVSARVAAGSSSCT